MSVFWAYVFKPFLLVAVLLLVYPARVAVQRWMRDGRLKEFLLRRV